MQLSSFSPWQNQRFVTNLSLSLEHLLGVLLLGAQWALPTLPDVKVNATRQESMTLKILLSQLDPNSALVGCQRGSWAPIA